MTEKLRKRNKFAKKLRRLGGCKEVEKKEDIKVRVQTKEENKRYEEIRELRKEVKRRKEYGRQFS